MSTVRKRRITPRRSVILTDRDYAQEMESRRSRFAWWMCRQFPGRWFLGRCVARSGDRPEEGTA